jgi:hypothetical protein
MPAEVMSLEFRFRPAKEEPPTYEFEEPTMVEELPFRYNAIHDIESVWWVGVWMMFLHKPDGYNEPEDKSRVRQSETSLVFPGTLTSDRRLSYIKDTAVFRSYTAKWISKEFLPAVGAFDVVRAVLRNLYQEIEETFPDGLSKLSATAGRHNTREAFPGGPKEDIYGPIQDTFLRAKVGYDNMNTKLESFKVSEKDVNGLKTGKQMSRRISGKRRADDGVAEEREGKGKRTRRLGHG